MTKSVALIVWLLGIVAWYVIRHPFARRAKKVATSQSLLDPAEWAVLAILTAGFFVIPAIYAATGFPRAFERGFSPMSAWLGVPVMVAALWLFRRSHSDLGKNWSVSLKMREGHRLVTGGVYRHVRHPMYSSFLLLGLAQLLLLPNWLAGGAGLIGTAVLLLVRVQREERMMFERFGDEYRAYCARTRRIIPWML
jgi:protein-S-isoprenylcysteine O-methyltransferase Ste14